MAGVLQFTLGLETSKFLDSLNISQGAVLGITGACEGLGKVVDRVWGQIEKGGALNDLSKRTGESAGNLFMLQKGFTAVGLSAESVGQAIFMMNKALGGVNEMGEDTSSIFEKAGLSVDELKKKGGAGAMQDILGKMAGMNQTSATMFAQKIFGRGGAADMVQASRQMDDFSVGMKNAQEQAKGFERMAPIFDAIEKSLKRVKEKLDPVFLVIAEKIAPVVKDLLDQINAFDMGPLVEKLGKFLEALKRSFGGAEFAELLTLSLQTGLEMGIYYGNKFVATLAVGLAAAIPEAVKAGLDASKILLSTFGEQLYTDVGNKRTNNLKREIADIEQGNGLNALIPEKNRKRMAVQRRKELAEMEVDQNDLRAGSMSQRQDWVSGAAKNITAAIKSGMQLSGETWSGFGPPPTKELEALKSKIKVVLDKHYLDPTVTGGATPPGKNIDFGNSSGKQAQKVQVEEGEKINASALEKMGFVLNGGTSSAAEQTAKNTASLVTLSRDILEALSGLPFFPSADQVNALPS